jgi:hypothetical protein
MNEQRVTETIADCLSDVPMPESSPGGSTIRWSIEGQPLGRGNDEWWQLAEVTFRVVRPMKINLGLLAEADDPEAAVAEIVERYSTSFRELVLAAAAVSDAAVKESLGEQPPAVAESGQ